MGIISTIDREVLDCLDRSGEITLTDFRRINRDILPPFVRLGERFARMAAMGYIHVRPDYSDTKRIECLYSLTEEGRAILEVAA